MNWYGTAGNGMQIPAGTRGGDPDSMCGNAVMYDANGGNILTVGGSPDYQGERVCLFFPFFLSIEESRNIIIQSNPPVEFRSFLKLPSIQRPPENTVVFSLDEIY